MSDKQQYQETISAFELHRDLLNEAIAFIKSATWPGSEVQKVARAINFLGSLKQNAESSLKSLKNKKKAGEAFPAEMIEQPEEPVEAPKQEPQQEA